MTKQEKQLLLSNLCARLPYGLKVYFKPSLETGEKGVETILEVIDVGYNVYNTFSVYPEDVIPYLRPMSSMTEEEEKEFIAFHCVNLCPVIIGEMLNIENERKMFDWLLEHHFDYCGLIEKGLAIEAPEGMYK